MKTLKSGIVCALLSLCFYTAVAQEAPPVTEPDYNKPKLFAQLPASVTINIQNLLFLFSAAEGQPVDIPFGTFRYQGVIISKSKGSDTTVQSVVVKSTNFAGSAFTLSKITITGNVFFRGRIFSRNHSDAFELQAQNGEYQLQKKHQLSILSE